MNLQAAAADFLSMTDLVSWEPGHKARSVSLLQHFSAGRLDASGLRAALGVASRPPDTRPPTRAMGVLRLSGILTPGESFFSLVGAGTSLRAFAADLSAAAADPVVTRIAVLVDSPGGFIGMVPETADLMRRVRAKKPVTVAVGGMNASAAYWITANATRIEATHSATVGSIGVYGERVSLTQMLEKAGVTVDVLSAGKFKTEGHEATPITDDERRAFQARIDEAYDQFVSDVSVGRGVAPSTIRGGYGQGRTVSATEALRLGMIDRVDLVDNTVARTAAAPDVAARAMAQQNELHAELLRLQFPSSITASPTGRLRHQYDEMRLRMEIALL